MHEMEMGVRTKAIYSSFCLNWARVATSVRQQGSECRTHTLLLQNRQTVPTSRQENLNVMTHGSLGKVTSFPPAIPVGLECSSHSLHDSGEAEIQEIHVEEVVNLRVQFTPHGQWWKKYPHTILLE